MHLRTPASRGRKTSAGQLRVALCGNPNCGKTTLFNALTGLSLKVANYPGVTVEKVSGTFELDGRRCDLLDIPGTYSLAARSPDEAIAVDALLGRLAGQTAPDVVVIVIDATQLARGLYLVSQILELGKPTVVALNMYDVAQRRGIRIDHRALAAALETAVVPMVARRQEGLDELRAAMLRVATRPPPRPPIAWPPEVCELVNDIVQAADSDASGPLWRGEGFRLLFDEQPVRRNLRGRTLAERIARNRRRLEALGGVGIEALTRAQFTTDLARRVAEHPTDAGASWTSRVDRVVLHRIGGPIIMSALMVAVFQSIFVWAQPLIGWVDATFTWAADGVRGSLAAGPLQSLIADGVIGGVGSVLVFLPQILVLFFFIGVLEDSGYMPRAAFIVDRIFRGCGLSGRSLIPLLSSFACAVPGIMATRTIDQRRQRLLTILVAPLMTCSARLPVYAILIAAFVPAVYVAGILSVQGLTLAAMYVLSMLVAGLVSLALNRTLLRGPRSSFVMELPSYKVPHWRNVFVQMLQRGRAFVTRAGTIILAVTVVLWVLSYYPRSPELERSYAQRIAQAQNPQERGTLEQERAGLRLQESFLGRTGRVLEPVSVHLGWDWKITMAVIASFPAREVIIATLGTIYNLGGEGGDARTLIGKLRNARWDHGPLAGKPVFSIAVACSVMVFFALCCQCVATLATIRRETNSWRWPLLVFFYMTTLAIGGGWLAYQAGAALGLA
jgi:ferrous iron transport protein B